MTAPLFENTTIPVLEQVVNFTQARHGILAGNLANLDTPGYRVRDLSPERFQETLREALEESRPASPPIPSSSSRHEALKHVEESTRSILYHDNSDVSLEHQIANISKNHATHNMALSIMVSQFRLLQAAISEQVA